MPSTTIVVTRPRSESAHWVHGLSEAGLSVVALPLIHIGPPPDAKAVCQSWATLSEFGLVVFVSPSAVHAWMQAKPAGRTWPSSLWAGATGPGTAKALQDHGVPKGLIHCPSADHAQFDGEALWSVLRQKPWQNTRVLMVRGADHDGLESDLAQGQGRPWLSEQLASAGAQVQYLAAYQRCLPEWSFDELTVLNEVHSRPEEHLWLFSSSVAVDNLAKAWQDRHWPTIQLCKALCTHPRIGHAAKRVGFAEVLVCPPTMQHLILTLQNMP